MKKGCAFVAAIWVVLVAAYAYIAWGRIHELVPTLLIAILGGTFAAALVGSFIGLFTGARDRAALQRAINRAALGDGRIEAGSGPIRPLGAALEAPFTGRPCVAYEYDVKRPDVEESDFAGVALAPCAVDTSRGPARVLGWAVLDQFPRASSSAIDRARGAAYLHAASFEKLGLTRLVSALGELMGDDDGAIRKDFRIGAETIDLEGRTIEERILPAGASVTILGRWSAAKQGFAPTGPASINRLFAGDLARTRKQIGGTSIKTFAMSLMFFLALHAILVTMYVMAPASP